MAKPLIQVIVKGNEVQGFVGTDQVYGVYIDQPDRLRVSTAQCPSGPLEKSRLVIECMQQVLDKVDELVASGKV